MLALLSLFACDIQPAECRPHPIDVVSDADFLGLGPSNRLPATAAGDVDGDGIADLWVGGYYHGAEGALWRGGPDPDPAPLSLGVQAASASIGDLDGDGLGDLVLGGGSPPSVTILWGGPARLETRTLAMASTDPVDVLTADLDGDGLDEVLAGVETSVLVYRGSDERPWVQLEVERAALELLGDVDGDGREDVLIGGSVYYGSAEGLEAASDDRTWSAGVGDLNGDGFADAIRYAEVDADEALDCVTGYCVVMAVHFGSPDGLGEEEVRIAPSFDFYAVPAAAGDLDQDGFDDLALAVPYDGADSPHGFARGVLYVVRGGAGGPHPPERYEAPDSPGVLLGDQLLGGHDHDGDGVPDVIAFDYEAPAEGGLLFRAAVRFAGGGCSAP